MTEVDATTYQKIGGSMAKPDSKAKLGSGGKFAALKDKLGKKKGISNPGAVAASIGRKKYGNAKMQSMAIKGRMNKEAAK